MCSEQNHLNFGGWRTDWVGGEGGVDGAGAGECGVAEDYFLGWVGKKVSQELLIRSVCGGEPEEDFGRWGGMELRHLVLGGV
jgi:hypothetical protein